MSPNIFIIQFNYPHIFIGYIPAFLILFLIVASLYRFVKVIKGDK